ncbi:MAG: VanZ family protein [Alphaproteobacteria bacterium]|nr:VanZ family protein [Verrucomicrobiota bacterium]MBN9571796.1 VanZ family protein [Alphaproteobacteria bacterium]OJV04290.1 MAG: hypothetical protein BGO12_00670 [Verrucomicrobia bacterium 61-8]
MAKALKAFSPTVERWWPAVLWMVLILFASLDWASGGTTFKIIQPILRWFRPDMPIAQVYEANLIFRKACHFSQFLILALLIWRTRGSWKFVSPKADLRFAGFVFLISFALAAGSEYVQSFFRSRTANVTDVFINLSGALAGILIALAIEITKTASAAKKARRRSRILLTANLLLHETERREAVLAKLRGVVLKTQPQAVVVAGNIGRPEQALECLQALKTASGGVPVAICLGPRDHWLPRDRWEQFPSPEAVRKHFWQPALEKTGVVGLDFQNLPLGDLAIVGAYGHFDLGFRDEGLSIDGEEVSLEAYLAGTAGGLEANDIRQIPFAAETLEEEAQRQSEGLSRRLAEVPPDRGILLVTGTVPFESWLDRKGRNAIDAFFRAFAGNSRMAAAILPHSERIRIAIFGGRENRENLCEVKGIAGTSLNHGTSSAEYALYDGETSTLERV